MEEIELEDTNFSIAIHNHGIIEDTFTKKVVYIIKTIDNSIEYIKFRSNTDFNHLRSQLSKKWVCLITPSFCKVSLTVLKNPSDVYLETKRKYLSIFLHKCIKNPGILQSQDFQLFIKGPDNFSELSRPLIPDFREIYARYALIYKNPGTQSDPEGIQKCLDGFKASIQEIKQLKKILKVLYSKYDAIKENDLVLNTKLNLIQENYISHLDDINVTNDFFRFSCDINPYEELLDWAIQENLSLKSMVEGIEKFFEVNKVSVAIANKINKKKNKIKEIQDGKSSLAYVFDARSDRDILVKENFSVNELENSVYCIDLLRNILSNQLLFNEIPNFNAEKRINYTRSLKEFCEKALKAFTVTQKTNPL